MTKHTLHLLKHPNTLESGGAIDTHEIEARSHAEAHARAVEIINAAPKQALEDERDRFILCDEDGHEIHRWGPDDA